jgi:endonuclease-8
MPEGDTVHRAARALQALVGEELSAQALHPRARSTGVAERLDGRRLLGVEARGKNLLFRFAGGYVLRSHLRMSGSWRVLGSEASVPGRPWLVLRGRTGQAVLRGGSMLELTARAASNLGPDILAETLDTDVMALGLRSTDPHRAIGEVLLDQRVVAGIGNVWRNEALWHARVSPWTQLADLGDPDLRSVLEAAATLMRRSLENGRLTRFVYRRAGRQCPRCGLSIRSRPQGDAARAAYWCPGCQRGPERGKEPGGT